MKQPLGVILAGGQATRMGGGDKGLLTLGRHSLLDHVIDRLSPQVAGVALNANGEPDRFARFGLPVLADSITGYAGPLAGVLAGLDWAAEQGVDTIVTAAADTPFFPGDLVPQLLLASEGQENPLVLAATPDPKRGRARHPTFGLWPVCLRNDLRAALQGGLRKVVLWTDAHGGRHRSLFQCEHARRSGAGGGAAVKLYGIVGWKNAGKTGLMERLVTEICGRGLTVSTIKHAHHVFDVDHPGKDSYRHRQAGATEVLLSSRRRFALMHELRDEEEPTLDSLLSKLAPVDLVLVEGYKRDAHPKVEAFRAETGNALIAQDDTTIRAVASDTAMTLDRPVFELNNTAAIADFILAEVGL